MGTSLKQLLTLVAAVLPLFVEGALSQSVVAKEGNIFVVGNDGIAIQLTFEGRDADPGLSLDGEKVVFVRRTPDYTINTGLGPVENNELWIAELDRSRPPRRVLQGRPGGFDPKSNLVVAGFSSPRFSPDGRRVYFIATTWVTNSAIHVLDLATGQTQYLYSGHSFEVIRYGKYAGSLIGGRRTQPQHGAGRSEYWLMDEKGRTIKAIGQEAQVMKFKRTYAVKN